ncbi:pilus assembly protein PilM [Candidatus Babeliales bacterium]|nr:pilus assembly protein PilM [Candidatus Babeliales bacterium]
MVHDIFIPCKVGTYYLHTKRVLSLEVTSVMVQGLLIEFSGNKVTIKQHEIVYLKDVSAQLQSSAIKKIVSSMGKVDEIVSTLSTSAVVFKELQLPFIGRDTLKMVIPFEVENMLPFALEEAIIDFVITQENREEKKSKVLIAAVRKSDVHAHYELFHKADVALQGLTIDTFALFGLYEHSVREVPVEVPKQTISVMQKISGYRTRLHNLFRQYVLRKEVLPQPISEPSVDIQFKPTRSELLIDISSDSIKVLYLKDGVLDGLRMIPFGITDGILAMSQSLNIPFHDLVQDILTGASDSSIDTMIHAELKKIFDEITRTLLYFEQKEGVNYLQPYKIIISGLYTHMPLFETQAKATLGSHVEVIPVQDILSKLHIQQEGSMQLNSEQAIVLAVGLSDYFDQDINYLQDIATHDRNSVIYLQLLAMVLASLLCIGGTWWRSAQQLQTWNTAFNSSKKQFIQTIETHMNIDLKNEKNLKNIVELAESKLKQERHVWFAFTKQQEASILEYLQDLSIAIDRSSIGLDLRQMHLDFEKVILSGSVKSFEALDTFDEELQSLKLLTLVEKPRELSWTIQLKSKAAMKGAI